ncbi:hypothetical protein BDV24DRAFT_114180 [Aspergillus arachidicola]|uniref:Uncharacterized protein n=1 Tax=Aspergillus arachidicola TaxID=656916 RepID=A0A5N6XU85_9EURO|nr:hypothetical protein BDV24DRAFT_114180 [Aspergillus arachidicola]
MTVWVLVPKLEGWSFHFLFIIVIIVDGLLGTTILKGFFFSYFLSSHRFRYRSEQLKSV